jgi:hypothetical protein
MPKPGSPRSPRFVAAPRKQPSIKQEKAAGDSFDFNEIYEALVNSPIPDKNTMDNIMDKDAPGPTAEEPALTYTTIPGLQGLFPGTDPLITPLGVTGFVPSYPGITAVAEPQPIAAEPRLVPELSLKPQPAILAFEPVAEEGTTPSSSSRMLSGMKRKRGYEMQDVKGIAMCLDGKLHVRLARQDTAGFEWKNPHSLPLAFTLTAIKRQLRGKIPRIARRTRRRQRA